MNTRIAIIALLLLTATPCFAQPANKSKADDTSQRSSALSDVARLLEIAVRGAEQPALNALDKLDQIAGSAKDKFALLKRSLNSESDAIRMSVLETIGRYHQDDPEVIAQLKRLSVEGRTQLERVLASRASLQLSDDPDIQRSAISQLIKALRSQDPAIANQAAVALRDAGEPAGAALLPLLADASPITRSLAAEVMGELGSEEATKGLTTLLQDDNALVRAAAVSAFGKRGTAAIVAVDPLIEILKNDPQDSVRARAALALAKIAPTSPRVSDELKAAAIQANSVVALASVQALASSEIDPASRARFLAETLRTAQPQIAAEITSQLVDLDDEGLAALVKAIEDDRSRYWAVLGLSEFGPKARPAAKRLASLIDSSSVDVKTEILIALANIKPPAASVANEISAQLGSDNNGVQYAASLAAVRIGLSDGDTQEALLKNTASDDKMLKLVSHFALAKLNPRNPKMGIEAIKALGVAVSSRDPRLVVFAGQAIRELKGK